MPDDGLQLTRQKPLVPVGFSAIACHGWLPVPLYWNGGYAASTRTPEQGMGLQPSEYRPAASGIRRIDRVLNRAQGSIEIAPLLPQLTPLGRVNGSNQD